MIMGVMPVIALLKKLKPRRIWSRFDTYILCGLLILLLADRILVRVWRHIPIGYNTTRLTGPLRPDGTVDYAAALNHVYSKGITPRNNAVPLLVAAMGIKNLLVAPAQRAEFCKLLKMKPPSKADRGVIPYSDWLRHNFGQPITKTIWYAQSRRRVRRLSHRAWSSKQHPVAARWIRANARPLSLLHQAVRRSRYYFPFVPPLFANPPPPKIFPINVLARLEAVRAMQHLGEGDTAGAIRDVLVEFRFAGLLGQERFTSYPYSCYHDAIQAETAILRSPKVVKNQIVALLRNLESLPAIAKPDVVVDRYVALAFLQSAARTGLRTCDEKSFYFSGESGQSPRWNTFLDAVIPTNFPALIREVNALCDARRLALEQPTYKQRRAALAAVDRKVGGQRFSEADNSLLGKMNIEPDLPRGW